MSSEDTVIVFRLPDTSDAEASMVTLRSEREALRGNARLVGLSLSSSRALFPEFAAVFYPLLPDLERSMWRAQLRSPEQYSQSAWASYPYRCPPSERADCNQGCR